MSFESLQLNKALNDERNSVILKLNSKQIAEMNKQVVSGLRPITKQVINSHLTILKGYRYVDEINDLKTNTYIKWIRFDTPNKLTKGAISCSVKITEDGMLVMCKNYYGAFFFVNMNECIVFQKITDEERVILSVMDYIDK